MINPSENPQLWEEIKAIRREIDYLWDQYYTQIHRRVIKNRHYIRSEIARLEKIIKELTS